MRPERELDARGRPPRVLVLGALGGVVKRAVEAARATDAVRERGIELEFASFCELIPERNARGSSAGDGPLQFPGYHDAS